VCVCVCVWCVCVCVWCVCVCVVCVCVCVFVCVCVCVCVVYNLHSRVFYKIFQAKIEKPTRFNIQSFPQTIYLCCTWNLKQATTFALDNIDGIVFITEIEIVL